MKRPYLHDRAYPVNAAKSQEAHSIPTRTSPLGKFHCKIAFWQKMTETQEYRAARKTSNRKTLQNITKTQKAHVPSPRSRCTMTRTRLCTALYKEQCTALPTKGKSSSPAQTGRLSLLFSLSLPHALRSSRLQSLQATAVRCRLQRLYSGFACHASGHREEVSRGSLWLQNRFYRGPRA